MKNKNLMFYIAGFLLIFGVSGLIYSFLPHTLIVGAVSVIVSFILIMILIAIKRKHRR
jgi:hypothetical protein